MRPTNNFSSSFYIFWSFLKLIKFSFFVWSTEGTESSSPPLRPYPSWQSHRAVNINDTPDIVSAFHIKVDRCHRLWVLDTGIEGVLANDPQSIQRLAPVRVSIFDLHTDNLIRQIAVPALNSDSSVFFNIAVDDTDCEKSFAYIARSGTPPSLTVYAYESNESWQVKHNFFNIDPLAGNFSVMGTNYRTTDGIYGLALSEVRANGYPDLYFHALTSVHEFNVSTAVLRNKSIAESAGTFYRDFKSVGSRGSNGQSGVSVYDPAHDIIFYTLPNQNNVGCWKTSSDKYGVNVGHALSHSDKMAYPIDVKIDGRQRLWILSNNFQMVLNGMPYDARKTNFHVEVIGIGDAIKHTPCEVDFIDNVVDRFNKAVRTSGQSSAILNESATLFTVIASALLACVFRW